MAKSKLPKINPSRLQRTVADVEFANDFTNFDDLCKAVAEHKWAKELSLNAWTIGALMIQHDTIVTMDKPDAMPEVDTPPPAAAPRPKHAPPQPQPVSDPAGPTVGDVKLEPRQDPKLPDDAEQTVRAIQHSNVTTYDEGGRGRKQCPSCKKYLGNRNTVCACGHEFVKAPASAAAPKPKSVGAAAAPVRRVESSQVETPQEYTPGRHVFCTVRQRTAIPAGACPVKLTGTDIQIVEEWAEKVRIHCQRERSQWMMLSALKYYAREFYDIFGSDYEIVKKHLDTLYASEERTGYSEEDE